MLSKRDYFTMADCAISEQTLTQLGFPAELASYIFYKYEYNWIVYVDDKESLEEQMERQDKAGIWQDHLKIKYEFTKDKYQKLLSLYDSVQADLLADLGSESETWFNDTPQNAGSFEAENFTSTYTKSKSKVKSQDTIVRLNYVHDLYAKLYEEWLEEFKPLFGTEVL